MITIDNTPYNLRYTLAAVDAIEATLGGKSILTAVAGEGAPPLSILRAWFAFALTESDGTPVPIERAAELFEKALTELGYKAIYELCASVFQRDCGFFFLPGIEDSST